MIESNPLTSPFTNTLSSLDSNRSNENEASRGVTNQPSASARTNNTASEYGSYSMSERFSQAQTFDLSVQTQDGDTVTLSFSYAESYSSEISASYANASSNNGSSRSSASYASVEASQSASISQGWQISVDGELDDEELAAIDQLLQDMGHIANDFFSGDVQAAFESAGEFKLDTSELSSMAMTLTQTQQYAAAYSAVEGYSESSQGSSRLGNMMSQLEDQQQNPGLSFIDNLVDMQKALIENLVQQDTRFINADSPDSSLNSSQSQLQEQLSQFVNSI